MRKQNKDFGRGFTIIEVSLVMAVAGLLFLMAFLALPALQRSARDSERREDVTLLLRKLKDYQSDNRGALPTLATGAQVNGITYMTGSAGEDAKKKTDWQAFYQNYLGANFNDPAGGSYALYVNECGKTVAITGTCEKATISKGRVSSIEDDGSEIRIVLEASCQYIDDENNPSYGYTTAVKTANPRKVAVLINLEGTGVYCSSS